MRLLLSILASFVGSVAVAAPSYDLVFTRSDGLSGSGMALERWVERAAWHGVELAPDATVVAWAAGTRAGLTQAAVEARLERQLVTLLRELPARPRTTAVLADPKYGLYLSPDVTWRETRAPEPSPEVIIAAKQAALDGQLDSYLGALLPTHPQYQKLVAAAERYAAMCQAGGWKALALPKPYLAKQGPPADVVRAFQERLAAEGYYHGELDGQLDALTVAALKAYREQRQLKDKGLDDAKLVESLNVTCAERVAQLGLNALRWRVSAWTPAVATWVEVNLAGQELRYYRDGALVMKQRTVVGSDAFFYFKPLNGKKIFNYASPVISDAISRVVVNPEWAVPARIAINEINKAIDKDPDYLAKHNFRTVTNKKGQSTFIQSSGNGNALGQIKILFPNSEAVYLHDTPKRVVFGYPRRALSHGCVRVQNAVDFGMALLKADADQDGRAFDEDALRARIGRTGPLNNDLVHPVPVFWEYYTASVDEDGNVRFHPDIYAYDEETAALTRAAQRAARSEP